MEVEKVILWDKADGISSPTSGPTILLLNSSLFGIIVDEGFDTGWILEIDE